MIQFGRMTGSVGGNNETEDWEGQGRPDHTQPHVLMESICKESPYGPCDDFRRSLSSGRHKLEKATGDQLGSMRESLTDTTKNK